MSSQTSSNRPVFAAILDLKITYVLSFLGAVASVLHNIPHVPLLPSAVALGSSLCVFYALMCWRRKLSSSTAVNGAILFIFLTAIGVAAIRSDFGPLQGLTSRYRIYSSLLLVFAWFTVAEHYLQSPDGGLRHRRIYLAGCGAAIAFSLVLDGSGYQFISRRNAEMIQGMSCYEHPCALDPTAGPVFTSGNHLWLYPPQFNRLARHLLIEAAAERIYEPPQF